MIIKIAHERTPFTKRIAQKRSTESSPKTPVTLCAVPFDALKGKVDKRQTLGSQENIRIDILLRTNV
jgi:LacI family transcriptional regulator